MKVHFFKYQATGNDFILVDNRDGNIPLTIAQIVAACDRRFGVGADGLIQIEKDPSADFKMVYYNSDGSQSLCGNGTRAAVKMASVLGMVNGSAKFSAYDGIHHASLLDDGNIRVRMNDVTSWRETPHGQFINTGSPHLMRYVTDLRGYPVVEEGRRLRYNNEFKPGGTNVNFVEPLPGNKLFVRTYERGVEDETLSCGTGVTAVALSAALRNGYKSPVTIEVMGGTLSVDFRFVPSTGTDSPAVSGKFVDIFLTGPAKMVFEGDLEL